ncbi:HTH domain-containing protein [Haloarcula sp. CGMCC 1.2071]|uniref:HTH domain-containing protein n=1 Tax=Haloarcula sp. CGMCC 1.2071 TaxID=3111454 RepID=UPI00300EF934
MDSTANPVRVELFVRSLCPGDATQQQNYLIDRLQALEDAGYIEDLSILIWGRRIEPRLAQRTAEGRHLLERLSMFEQWERDADASLAAFDWEHPLTNMVSDESVSVITLPTLALAEYVDDDLTHVAPCTRDGTVHRVTDRVNRLADTADLADELEHERTVVQ